MKASVDHWALNQLRHSRATDICSKFGLEAIQVILGDSQADTTQIYAERANRKLRCFVKVRYKWRRRSNVRFLQGKCVRSWQ